MLQTVIYYYSAIIFSLWAETYKKEEKLKYSSMLKNIFGIYPALLYVYNN